MCVFKFTAYKMLLNVDYKIVTNSGNYLFGTVRVCKSFTAHGMNSVKVIKGFLSKNHTSL